MTKTKKTARKGHVRALQKKRTKKKKDPRYNIMLPRDLWLNLHLIKTELSDIYGQPLTLPVAVDYLIRLYYYLQENHVLPQHDRRNPDPMNPMAYRDEESPSTRKENRTEPEEE